jgi:beta-lactamase family protein
LRQKALNFSPGAEWQYSNSNYVLLSLIVKRASGIALADFEADNIFGPLGMTHTHYRDDHTLLIPHRALAYSPGKNGTYRLNVSYQEETGDGMIQTSIEDLIKWDETFYTGKVGGKELIDAMEQPGKLNDMSEVEYSKGLFIGEYRGLKTIYHSGGSGGYRAYLLRFPEQHFSAACLCNLSTLSRCGPSHASPTSRRIYGLADEYLAGVMAPRREIVPADMKAGQLRVIAGTYRDPVSREVWRVTVTGGKLWVDFEGEPLELRALSPTTFEPVDYPFPSELRFEARNDARTRRLIVRRPVFTTVLDAVDEPRLTPALLAGLAGDYFSPELRVTYRLAMKNQGLWMLALMGCDGVVHNGEIPLNRLRPSVTDEFTLDGAPITITFTRDQGANVIGFTLGGALARGIVFVRSGQTQ